MLKRSLKIMKLAPFATLLVLLCCGCEELAEPRSKALPDNVKADQPIVIREGQAVLLVPDGDESLVIVATVLDGKLNVAELDQEGRNFGVIWNDSDSWMTSVLDSDGDSLTLIVDEDGDGLRIDESLNRKKLSEKKWLRSFPGPRSKQKRKANKTQHHKSDRAGESEA